MQATSTVKTASGVKFAEPLRITPDRPACLSAHAFPVLRARIDPWDNVVSACQRCNHLKADRTLAELGWRLRRTPRQPVGTAWRIIGTGRSDPCWAPYLTAYGGEVASVPATA